MEEMNEAISKIETSDITKIARSCGALFDMADNLKDQFAGVKLRGFTDNALAQIVNGNRQFVHKNVFEDCTAATSAELRKS